MAERDMFHAREHWLEETYFRKRDQELIEKLHERRARETERQHMADSTGITDPAMLEELQADGYTEETVALLPLIPLVEVAWAEGGVADRERRMIFEIARSRGIEPGSKADEQLTAWLDKRPPERFFEDTLHALGLMLETMPPADRQSSREDLLVYCNKIAELVAGGILGRAQIGDQERGLIAHIAEEIGAQRS
ncbi:MAG: hypothetical protein ACREEM_22815 [Blastocatellia bacterium]